MAYCTNAELTLLTGTTLSTAIQDAIIDQADREIKAYIKAEGLTPPAADDDLKAASINLSKVGIITHNRMTGTQPKSAKVGDITIQDDLDKAIEALTTKAWQSVDAYIESNTPTPTSAAVPLPKSTTS
jgi:hypothetical protein